MPAFTNPAPLRSRRKSHLMLGALALSVFLAGCAETQLAMHGVKRMGNSQGTAAPGEVGAYKIGTPYEIAGQWYYPAVDYEYQETGIASWYGPKFHGKRTANGELFDQNVVSGAHRTLPLPSIVRVTNLENGRSIKVRINDRGPFSHGRIIDMSRKAAELLGFEKKGTAKVRVEILPEESQQIARLAQGEQNIAQVSADEKTTVTAAPRDAVEAMSLDGPITDSGAPTTSTVRRTPSRPVDTMTMTETNPDIRIDQVVPSEIYVQAGAFSVYDNAMNLRNRLYALAPSKIEPIDVKGTTFYRVRLGPLNTVPEADILLERVIASGQNGAKVVVECADGANGVVSGC
ncbi:MAG: septal ring lytic transglycosylase RlpA family protein [Pseudomonadota bacterium]